MEEPKERAMTDHRAVSILVLAPLALLHIHCCTTVGINSKPLLTKEVLAAALTHSKITQQTNQCCREEVFVLRYGTTAGESALLAAQVVGCRVRA